MAMIEFLIILFNIIILSTIYSTIVFGIAYLLSKTTQIEFFKRVTKRKMKFWLASHFTISVILLIVAFSYGQDTGIGDNSKIPVGYGETIQSEDFAWTYFYPDPDKTTPNRDELKIDKYKVYGKFLCAELPDGNGYIVYNLHKHKLTEFKTTTEYLTYASQHKLPKVSEFDDFRTHYHQYLDSRPIWKIWLLP